MLSRQEQVTATSITTGSFSSIGSGKVTRGSRLRVKPVSSRKLHLVGNYREDSRHRVSFYATLSSQRKWFVSRWTIARDSRLTPSPRSSSLFPANVNTGNNRSICAKCVSSNIGPIFDKIRISSVRIILVVRNKMFEKVALVNYACGIF